MYNKVAKSKYKNFQSESANRASAILYAFADKFLSMEEGKTRENEDMRSLLRKLLDSGRMDDLKKASEDAAYCMKLKEEFNI